MTFGKTHISRGFGLVKTNATRDRSNFRSWVGTRNFRCYLEDQLEADELQFVHVLADGLKLWCLLQVSVTDGL